LNNPNLLNTLRMAFTGHEVCHIDNNAPDDQKHKLSGIGGLASSSTGKAILCNRGSGLSLRISTAVHEFGHLYYALDHYAYICGSDPTRPGINNYCIWGYNNTDPEVYSNNTICTYCKNILKSNMSNYYIHSIGGAL